MTTSTDLLCWSAWQSLFDGCANPLVPRQPGLYQVRRHGRDDLDYIGQTSRSLRGRIGMLRDVYADAMPFRDPHTAAPALWALRHGSGCEFEVSVAPIDGSTPWRKGMEALAIGLYRQDHGRSPTVEFGRMPIGYRMSSRGTRCRGGPSTEPNASHGASIPPVGSLTDDPLAPDWCGHAWSRWVASGEALASIPREAVGLYRIHGVIAGRLLYVGQGPVRQRVASHLRKVRDPGHEQGRVFGPAADLACSWKLDATWLPQQRLELEHDLIAAYVLHVDDIPAARFLDRPTREQVAVSV